MPKYNMESKYTHEVNDDYREGFDRIFGKKSKTVEDAKSHMDKSASSGLNDIEGQLNALRIDLQTMGGYTDKEIDDQIANMRAAMLKRAINR